MTNIGRPSQGCFLCRKRKLKCDQKKPSCTRCEKFGVQCPGYENPDKWLFVDKRGKPVKSATGKAEDHPSPPIKRSSPSTRSPSTSASMSPLPVDYDSESLNLFLTSHVSAGNSTQGDPGYLGFLPNLLAGSDPQSCLQKAVTALALRNLINRKQCFNLTGRATESLIEALTSTNQALADPSLALRDETLAAIYLLSLNESMNTTTVVGSWKGHIRGALHLLRLRGSQQFRTSQGRQLFRHVHTPVLIRSFRDGEEPPEESQHMVQLFQQFQVPNHFSSKISVYFYKVVMLRAKLGKVIQKDVLSFDDFGGSRAQKTRPMISLLIAQGQALDATSDFSNWAATDTDDDSLWQRYVTIISSDPTDPDASKQPIFYWRSYWVMSQWIRGWTARMYLYITLLRALDHVHSDGDGDYERDFSKLEDVGNVSAVSRVFEEILHETVDNVLCSIDYALGDIDQYGRLAQCDTFLTDPAATAIGPFYIFYALEIIVTSALTTPRQRTIATKALRRIGRERGFGRLLHWQYQTR